MYQDDNTNARHFVLMNVLTIVMSICCPDLYSLSWSYVCCPELWPHVVLTCPDLYSLSWSYVVLNCMLSWPHVVLTLMLSWLVLTCMLSWPIHLYVSFDPWSLTHVMSGPLCFPIFPLTQPPRPASLTWRWPQCTKSKGTKWGCSRSCW